MVRLLLQEIRFRRNSIIGWGVGMCFFPIVYLGIYPQMADEVAGLADLEIYQTMGVSLGTLEDWIASILLLFVPLILSIFAIVNGTGTLAGEEEDGRLEMIVTLPLPRWQIITAKAIALSVSTFLVLLIVSLASIAVFKGIEGQIETDLAGLDIALAMLATWPLVFTVGMISLFLAAFCSRRRIASIIGAVIIIVSYFGTNLASSVSSIEPLKPLFLFTYLDFTSKGVTDGQPADKVLVLLAVSLVSFALALFFFQRRKLTVGAWPWQGGKAPVKT